MLVSSVVDVSTPYTSCSLCHIYLDCIAFIACIGKGTFGQKVSTESGKK